MKHLVIGGGGPLGLRFLGVLEKLEKERVWKRRDLVSIYGTSVGAILGAMIALNYDWDTLNQYLIERPWQDVFQVSAKQIMDSYYHKGVLDQKPIDTMFKSLLQGKHLNVEITLKEFADFSGLELHVFTFDLNSYETVELSALTHPDLSLLQAIAMSSALPGIFMPILQDGKCFIDGGIQCNYPVRACLERFPDDSAHIMGVKSSCDDTRIPVTKDTSLLEFITCLAVNTIHYLRDAEKNAVKCTTVQTVVCEVKDNPLALDFLRACVCSATLRRELIIQGEMDASHYLLQKEKEKKELEEKEKEEKGKEEKEEELEQDNNSTFEKS